MRAAAGFRCNGRCWTCRQKLNQLWVSKLFTVNSFPMTVLTVDVERIFTQIDTNEYNVCHDDSPNEGLSHSTGREVTISLNVSSENESNVP